MINASYGQSPRQTNNTINPVSRVLSPGCERNIQDNINACYYGIRMWCHEDIQISKTFILQNKRLVSCYLGVDCNQIGGNGNENNKNGNDSSSGLDNENDGNTVNLKMMGINCQSKYESGQKQIHELRKLVQKLIKEHDQSERESNKLLLTETTTTSDRDEHIQMSRLKHYHQNC